MKHDVDFKKYKYFFDGFIIRMDKKTKKTEMFVKGKFVDTIFKTDITEKAKSGFDDMVEIKDADMQFLKESIAKLPDIYKTALELKYFHEMSNSEIAVTLGIKPHNAAVRISRAIAMLTEILQESE